MDEHDEADAEIGEDAQTLAVPVAGGMPESAPGDFAARKSERPTVMAPTPGVMSQPAAVTDLGGRIVETSFAERYVPGKVLGVGGIGEVRLMADRRVGRGVAMKVLRRDKGSNDASRVRFIWEARVQAQLEHPAIVPVYDIGLTPDGAEYFTMKRIGGRTLADVLARLRRKDPDAIREHPRAKLLGAFLQVCLAVEYAHRRGAIHRDIKPENIMLGELGEVYVLDWGLAKVGATAAAGADASGDVAMDATATDATVMSRQPKGQCPSMNIDGALSGVVSSADALDTGESSADFSAGFQSAYGAILGTPGYMAPEQAAGNPDIDERADVFALGAVLFEILTHRRLHEGERTFDLLQATLKGVDVEARARDLDLDVAPELVALCAAATRRAPHERLSSPQSLADGIQLYLDGDRDVAARKELARHHIAEARAARARGDGEQDRQVAMRAAGRALALDPTATEAADLVGHLLLRPPIEVPVEVERQLDAIDLATGRSQGRIGSIAMTGYLWFVPLLWWTGIRDPSVVVAFVVVSLLAAGQIYWMTRGNTIPHAAIYLSSVISAVLIALVCRLVGPFIIAPTLVLTTLMAYAVHPRFGRVSVIAAILTAGVAMPWLLEVVGVLEPTYHFERGALVLAAPAITFSPGPVQLAFAVLLCLQSVITAVLLRSMASKQREVTKQIELQAWHLRQIVPTPVV